jgi:NodT family efflux transporter outer membrane factor (OMF) lipoprotein
MAGIGRSAARLAGVLLVAGCTTVGPDHQPPSPELPEAYNAPVPGIFAETASGEHRERWWTAFEDPVLNDLMRRALRGNLDVRVAASRVREARAAARGVVAGTGPSVNASAEAGVDAAIETGDGDTDTGGALTGILDAQWEIDLFGGLQRRREAAWAEAARQAALRRETRRTTAAAIARNYIELRAAERRRQLLETSLALQRRTLTLVRDRVQSGLSRQVDAMRAQAEVDRLRADLGPLSTEIARRRNALAVLLGAPPGELNPTLRAAEPEIPRTVGGTVVGVPANLLRRRPDIQAAELQLAVATAEVGVATADLYPRLTLPGRIRVGASELATGNAVGTALASIAALVEVALFDGGQRGAQVEAAQERMRQAMLTYRQTVLRAVDEVESALVGYRGLRDRRNALIAAVDANRTTFRQSRALYREGLSNFLDVLDSQRQLTTARQELAETRRDLALEAVALYSALGGPGPQDERP